jgi:uncharacterized protein (TIGR02996 family)
VYDAIDPLLRAMRANPKDFAPRLAYTDVLDDLGHTAAAAFVRRHCEVYRMPVWHPERRSVAARPDLEAAMAAADVFPAGKVYIDPSTLDLRIGTPWDGLTVYRGLIDQFSGTLEEWVQGANAHLRWHPIRSARVESLIGSGSFVVTSDWPDHPGEVTIVMPGADRLGPVPVPAGRGELAAALTRLLTNRWPVVRFRVCGLFAEDYF